VPAGVVGGAKATGGSVPVGVVGGSQPVGQVDMSRVTSQSGGVFVPDGGKVDMSRVSSGGVFVPSGGKAKPDVVTPFAAPKKGGGGFLGGLRHALGQTGADLYHAAVNTPSGVYALGKATAADVGYTVGHGGAHNPHPQLAPLGVGIAKATVQDVRHPLRHPGNTLLDFLAAASLGAGTAARVGEAGRVASASGDVGSIAKALAKGPKPGMRTLTSEGVTAAKPASRAALTRTAQRAADRALERTAAQRPAGKVAQTVLPRRVAKWNDQTARVAEAIGKGPAAALAAVGRKLTVPEQAALKVVGEGVPLREQIQFHQARAAKAGSRSVARRHEFAARALDKAGAFIDDSGAAPKIRGDAKHLQRIYDETAKVSRSTDMLRQNLGLVTEEASKARISAPGRIIRGADFEAPTPAKLGKPSQALVRQRAQVARLEQLASRSAERDAAKATPYPNVHVTPKGVERPANPPRAAMPGVDLAQLDERIARAEARASQTPIDARDAHEINAAKRSIETLRAIRTEATQRGGRTPGVPSDMPPRGAVSYQTQRLGGALNIAREQLDRMEAAAARRVKPTGLIGAETSTAGDIYVPSKAKVGAKGLGRVPRVAPQGTLGRPQLPGTVTHPYTGALKQAGRERLDTTQLVAEHALETHRFQRLTHLRDVIRPAVHSDLRPNDVVVRLDNLARHDSLPQIVQDVLNKHDSGVRLSRDELNTARSAFEKVRSQIVPGKVEDLPPDVQAQLDKLLSEGKVGFVNRNLLGDLARPATPLQTVTGSRPVAALDAVNNGAKFAILYAKPAYALPNLLGNVALNLVQQGPVGLVRTLADTSRLSFQHPELTARVDELMGEGVSRSIVAGDQGVGSRIVGGAASLWGKGVDVPFRRSAFLYEARRLGYRNAGELERLLTDERLQPDLIEATQRATTEIIDYDRLTPMQKEVVRRVVFFLPWVKGATYYAGHFVTSHPLQAEAAGQIGRQGYEQNVKDLGPFPSWFEGNFKSGSGVVNPASAAILQTPAQVAAALAQLGTGRAGVGSVGDLSNFLTPALNLILAQTTHTNPATGRPETGGLPQTAMDTIVKGLPQYSLVQALRGHPAPSKLYPPTGKRKALERFAIGGLARRPYNAADLHRLAELEKKGR
jgi:hypothetical protein